MKYLILALMLPLSANAAGKIINADIAPSGTANIALNKLAASTAHNVCTFDNSGFIAGGVAPGASGNILQSNGTDWASVTNTAALSVGAFSVTPTNPGLTLSSNVLNMDPADATHPGGMSATTQTFGGAKTFSSTPTFSTMTAGSVFFAGTSGILSQDNSNFFWDATNHRIGIGTATPRGYLDIINTADSLLLSPTIAGAGGSDNNSWLFYAGATGAFSIWNRNQLLSGFGLNSFGNVTLGAGAGFGHPLATVLMKNQTTATTLPTLVVEVSGAQTADLIDFADVSEATIAKVDVVGKAFFTNIRDTALGAGVVRSDSSGDFTAAELSADVTTSGSNATTVAKIQGTTVSGTTGTTNVVFSTSPTMSNPVVGTQSFGDNSTKAASTAFVQTALAQLNPATSVYAASVANVAGTYTNAVAGVCIGDTFTTTATTAFALDGTSPPVGSRILFKNQTSAFQNGVWTLTTQAVGGISGAILTRALDYDTAADMNAGQVIPIINGTQSGQLWFQTAVITTCSSDNQSYSQAGSSGGGCASPVLTKTADYTISTSDFTCANKVLLVECNCTSAACTLTMPAASNTGYEADIINIGTKTCTVAAAGSDTFGSTTDQTWIMPSGGDPQTSNIFKANGGTRWNGF